MVRSSANECNNEDDEGVELLYQYNLFSSKSSLEMLRTSEDHQIECFVIASTHDVKPIVKLFFLS